MPVRLFTSGLVFLLVTTFGCQMRSSSQSEAEVRQWLDRWGKAFSTHDVNTIMSMYAPEVVAYDIVAPLQYVGKDAYRKDLEQFMGQYEGPLEVEYRDLHVTAGDDVAFAAGLERITGTIKGQKSTLWARFTSGFRKINGAWLDVQDHISVPTDFETGKAMLELKP